jgi:penicillin-binding protein 1A
VGLADRVAVPIMVAIGIARRVAHVTLRPEGEFSVIDEQLKGAQAALVAIDPRTGYVRALVGGREWNHSNFNRATQARRQPGSAFKPFVYVAAIDNGFHPTDVIVDEPVSFPGGNGELYQPMNYDRQFRGPVTLRYALQQSINIPAIKLLRKVGTSLVGSYARRMGIRSPVGQNLSMLPASHDIRA